MGTVCTCHSIRESATSQSFFGQCRVASQNGFHWTLDSMMYCSRDPNCVLHLRAFLAALPTNPPEWSHRVWYRNGWEGCSGYAAWRHYSRDYWKNRNRTGVIGSGEKEVIIMVCSSIWRNEATSYIRYHAIFLRSLCMGREKNEL